jgi:hypothetical protein
MCLPLQACTEGVRLVCDVTVAGLAPSAIGLLAGLASSTSRTHRRSG